MVTKKGALLGDPTGEVLVLMEGVRVALRGEVKSRDPVPLDALDLGVT